MPRGDQATARLHRDWLKRLPDLTGRKLTTLAKEINVSPSTLTRPVSEGEDGTSTLHATTIAKIVAHTGAPPPTDLAGPPARGRTGAPRGFEEEAVPYRPLAGDPVAAAVLALIAGRNAVDPWTLRTRALELAGFLPGDIVLVDLNAAPQPGDAVCAQVYDWPRMKAETVMRVLIAAPPVQLLVARTVDPEFTPLVVDGERVVVKGVVLPHRLRGRAAAET
jgi:hypothetical protein